MDLRNLTIEQIRKGLMKKQFSAVELIKFYLNKIKKENKKYNDFITITEKLALGQAKKVDAKISQREKIGPLEGIPIAIKDNILVEDYKTTAGSRILENYIAPYDATVIKKLKEAGAIIIGKTNLDEFAMGSSTENSAFGIVKNPNDITRVPGGSSGGSAVAVALNHCLGALGSDTGGSVRQPASFCGIVGFKPSYGMVSRYGLIAMASSLDQIGTLANTVDDAQLIFNIIRGKDLFDSTTIDVSKYQIPNTNYNKIRVGVPQECFGQGLDESVRKAIERILEKSPFEVKRVNLPHLEYALSVYYILTPAEISANLARYDSIKYGYQKKGKDLLDQYLKTRASGLGNEVRRRIILGTYVLSAGYWEAYYGKAQKVRAIIKKEFDSAFKGADVLLTPTAPTPAFKFNEKQDPLSMYLSDIYTVPVNLAGLPAISIPAGKKGDLPIGLQIIGPQFKDDLVLEIAKKYESRI